MGTTCYSVKMQQQNHSCYCYDAVSALKEVCRKLRDSYKNIRNWKMTDLCEPQREWKGVICTEDQEDDAYVHVQELYVAYVFHFVFMYLLH